MGKSYICNNWKLTDNSINFFRAFISGALSCRNPIKCRFFFLACPEKSDILPLVYTSVPIIGEGKIAGIGLYLNGSADLFLSKNIYKKRTLDILKAYERIDNVLMVSVRNHGALSFTRVEEGGNIYYVSDMGNIILNPLLMYLVLFVRSIEIVVEEEKTGLILFERHNKIWISIVGDKVASFCVGDTMCSNKDKKIRTIIEAKYCAIEFVKKNAKI